MSDLATSLTESETLLEGLLDNRKRMFVIAYSQTGRKDKAARAAGVSQTTIYHWRQHDEIFQTAMEKAEKITVELCETEAIRRGKDGYLKPIYHSGTLVGHVREYSDTLLMFLLKGLNPERYVERKEIYKVDVAARLREGRARAIAATRGRIEERKRLAANIPNAEYRVVTDDEGKAEPITNANKDGTMGLAVAEPSATPTPLKQRVQKPIMLQLARRRISHERPSKTCRQA